MLIFEEFDRIFSSSEVDGTAKDFNIHTEAARRYHEFRESVKHTMLALKDIRFGLCSFDSMRRGASVS